MDAENEALRHVAHAVNLVADAMAVGTAIAHALRLAGCVPVGLPTIGENGEQIIRMHSPAGVTFVVTLQAENL